jgi:hypothetical protein
VDGALLGGGRFAQIVKQKLLSYLCHVARLRTSVPLERFCFFRSR